MAEWGLNNVQIGKRLGVDEASVRRGLASVGYRRGARTGVEWGYGAAKSVPLATKEDTELVVFVSDLHFPFQHDGAVASSLHLIHSLQPHRVVINGDVADFFQLSHFNTGLERLDDLQAEINQANKYRRDVREAAPLALIDETEGNHDNRIISYVEKNARALASLDALDPSNLFQYKALEITHHPGAGFLLRPNFLVKHGTLVRGEAGATAKAEFMQAGISGISGHTHRLSTYRKGGYVQRQWTEQGCLCRTDPDYIVGIPSWQQGCAVGEFSTKSSAFVIHEVPFVDGSLRFGGQSF